MNLPFSFVHSPARAGLLALASTAICACTVAGEPVAQDASDHWRQLGNEALQSALAREPVTGRANGIILFIGDGMGIATVTASRIYAGQLAGGSGEEHSLSFETFPYTALMKTYNVNQQTPDSAGTMSAMITGVKTDAGLISVNADATRRDCASSLGNEVTTLLEELEQAGWSTGVVSTTRLTHATPAATYAHAPERGWEDDSAIPRAERGKGCKDIARQLIEFPYGNGLEVALGGGRRHFLPRERDGKPFVDPEFPDTTGRRLDGRDLTEEWRQRERAAWVWNQAQLDALDLDEVDHLLGTFNPSHMQYELDRDNDPAGEPSLAAMTEVAIRILSRNPKGFLLIVEGGRIDHAHHATNAKRAFADTVALADAVTAAGRMTDERRTLMIVTADHSHVMSIAGYASRGNPILDIVRGNDASGEPTGQPILAEDALPYTTIGYANGRGGRLLEAPVKPDGDESVYDAPVTVERRLDLIEVDTQDHGFHLESLVPLEAETHGGEDVSLYARGPWAHLFTRTEEQSYIYYVMRHAAGLDAGDAD